MQGIDSYVGEFKSPTLEIGFDYGWYSDKLEAHGTRREWVVIDGKSALVAYDAATVSVHFPSKTLSTLTFHVKTNDGNLNTAEAIIRSIHFL